MANRLRDARKEDFWRDAVRRQARAGVSVREFCRREGLGESNFYAWRRTIAERDARMVGGGDGKRGAACRGGRRKADSPSVVKTGREATSQAMIAGKSIRVAKATRKEVVAKKAASKEAIPAFVPIVASEAFGGHGEIVLEFGGGRRLRFDATTSPERVASIVHALESEGAT